MPLLANLRPDKLTKGDLCLVWTGIREYVSPGFELGSHPSNKPWDMALAVGSFQDLYESPSGIAGTYHLHCCWFYTYEAGRWGPLTFDTYYERLTPMTRRFFYTTRHGDICHGGQIRGELDCDDRYAMTQYVKQCLPVLTPVLEDNLRWRWDLGQDPAAWRW